jgi:hypothetical protein
VGASGLRLLSCRRRTCRSVTGSLTNISFVTPVNVQESPLSRHEDGLLPTLLFQRVFISGGGHYVWSWSRREPTRRKARTTESQGKPGRKARTESQDRRKLTLKRTRLSGMLIRDTHR